IHIQVAARPDTVGDVARRLDGTRVNGVRVDLTCTHDDKLSRLGQIADLGGMIEDVEVIPPSLEDLYTHFSRRTDQ
ncbi:MAG: ABC transporter ATP-binding protein, partial [Roseovarius sp.]